MIEKISISSDFGYVMSFRTISILFSKKKKGNIYNNDEIKVFPTFFRFCKKMNDLIKLENRF